jgi:hypothetical protein
MTERPLGNFSLRNVRDPVLVWVVSVNRLHIPTSVIGLSAKLLSLMVEG